VLITSSIASLQQVLGRFDVIPASDAQGLLGFIIACEPPNGHKLWGSLDSQEAVYAIDAETAGVWKVMKSHCPNLPAFSYSENAE
jgi:hypothetical protein